MIEKAKQDYFDGMKYKDIAKKYDVSLNTVKSWVTRYGWAKLKKGAHKNKKGAHKKDGTHTDKTREEKATKKIIKEVVANKELTDKQQLFCIYYIEDFNATKAYQKAYGCNYEASRRCGSRLLTNVDIKLEIERLTQECLSEKEINSKVLAKRLLQKYIDIAFADITDYVEFGQEDIVLKDDAGNPLLDKNGEEITILRNYVNFKSSDEVDGTIISEVSKGKDGVKIKLQDKMKALDFLAKHIGLLSAQDQVKIETEKAKTQKLQLEIEKIKGDDSTQAAEIWVENLLKLYEEEGNKDGQRTH